MASEAQILAQRRNTRKSTGLRIGEARSMGILSMTQDHGQDTRATETPCGVTIYTPTQHSSLLLASPCKTKPIPPRTDRSQALCEKEVTGDLLSDGTGETKPILLGQTVSSESAGTEAGQNRAGARQDHGNNSPGVMGGAVKHSLSVAPKAIECIPQARTDEFVRGTRIHSHFLVVHPCPHGVGKRLACRDIRRYPVPFVFVAEC